jgi:hypothetical protein
MDILEYGVTLDTNDFKGSESQDKDIRELQEKEAKEKKRKEAAAAAKRKEQEEIDRDNESHMQSEAAMDTTEVKQVQLRGVHRVNKEPLMPSPESSELDLGGSFEYAVQ